MVAVTLRHLLVLSRLPDKAVAVLRASYNRSAATCTLSVSNNGVLATFQHGYNRVGSTKVNTYCASHIFVLLLAWVSFKLIVRDSTSNKLPAHTNRNLCTCVAILSVGHSTSITAQVPNLFPLDSTFFKNIPYSQLRRLKILLKILSHKCITACRYPRRHRKALLPALLYNGRGLHSIVNLIQITFTFHLRGES